MAKKKVAPPKKAAAPMWIWIGLGIVLVAAVVIFAVTRPAVKADLPQEISVSEASAMRSAGAFILDVREPVEWEEAHIADATLIPLGQLASRVNEVPKDKEIVVVCRSGNRSQEGRDILLQAGFEQVTSMTGGIRGWQSAGMPTVSGQ